MRRLDALRVVYPQLEQCVVVTIMGAVAVELQSLGHRPNFFYLQHAMGLASSMGLGIALTRPERQVVVLDGDGSVLMNLGGLTTLARYRPRNLIHVVFDNDVAARDLTTIVAKVEAVGPSKYVTDLSLLENRFQFQRYLKQGE